MTERKVVLDVSVPDESNEALKRALSRAEEEIARLKRRVDGSKNDEVLAPESRSLKGHATSDPTVTGVEALREDEMMRHLLDSLEQGQDIGHYGRLVFAMVARHFMSDDDVVAELTRDRDFSAEQASTLLRQVESRDYNPPRRERILEWQKEQSFSLIPKPNDPDCGNVYRSLHFPTQTYKHIEEYQEERTAAE